MTKKKGKAGLRGFKRRRRRKRRSQRRRRKCHLDGTNEQGKIELPSQQKLECWDEHKNVLKLNTLLDRWLLVLYNSSFEALSLSAAPLEGNWRAKSCSHLLIEILCKRQLGKRSTRKCAIGSDMYIYIFDKDASRSLQKLLSFKKNKPNGQQSSELWNGNWWRPCNYERKLLIGPEHTLHRIHKRTSCSLVGKYGWKAVRNHAIWFGFW